MVDDDGGGDESQRISLLFYIKTCNFTFYYDIQFLLLCYCLYLLTGPNRTGDSESDCKSRDCEFNPSLVPYLCED